MPRSVNHVASRARRKKILKRVKGQFGARKNVWTPCSLDSAYQRSCSSRGYVLLTAHGCTPQERY